MTDGCAAVGYTTTQQWRRMHGNAESEADLEMNTTILFLCFFVSLFPSFFFVLDYEYRYAGVLFVFNPVFVQMVLSAPDALASLHRQVQGSQQNKPMSQSPRILYT